MAHDKMMAMTTAAQPCAATAARRPPLGLPVATPYGRYFYDTATNRLLRVSGSLFRLLAGWPQNGPGEVADGQEEMASLQQQGLLHPGPIRSFGLKQHRRCIAGAVIHRLCQLTLEVTEQCNLRCRYCIYGAGYDNQRAHGAGRMEPAVVDQALDYFFAHNTQAEDLSVGFYGGEPLLAFDLIRHGVAAVARRPQGQRVSFHMTTNGMLLTEDKYEFSVTNGFSLLVSLDGPPCVHDRYRRTAGGRQTYAQILRNLKALHRYDTSYYRDNVMFSSVHVPATRLSVLARFFSRHPELRTQRSQVSDVSDGCPALAASLSKEATAAEVQADSDGLWDEYLDRVVSNRRRGARFAFLQDVYGRPFITFHKRELCAGADASTWIHGMCIPASRKLFVARDGTYYTCERVGRGAPIGDVRAGVNMERVFSILRAQSDVHRRQCETCWAVRLCGACQSSIWDKDGVSKERLRAHCRGTKEALARVIGCYIRVLEANTRAWDFIEEIAVK